jgi:hypothetical protein
MAFPETILPIEVAFAFDGSTWTDVTSDVRHEQKIRITRGRSDWGQQTDFGRCSFALSNTDGKYSPRNPEGPHYGSIGRNTPVRVSVETGSVACWLPATSSSDSVSTPDAAALDITGDIDVRLDAGFINWYMADSALGAGTTSSLTELFGKWTESGNQRSWVLYSQIGYLEFAWTTDGTTSTMQTAVSTAKLPVPASGRLAVRVTLDVDNGAGGNTVRFYTSDTISGTWTQLGGDVVGGATTSIYSSTASLIIGSAINGTAWDNPLGYVYGAEVRNGIGGAAAANPNFTAQTPGATNFADSAGRTWSTSGLAEITNRKIRFVGEVSSWTPEKNPDGNDVICKVEASGIMRRLGQGAIAAKSPMYREFTSPYRSNIVAYWPMEDASGATSLGSAFDGHPAIRITGSVTPAAYSHWAASDPIPTIGTGSMKVAVPTYTATSYLFLRFFAAVPAAGVVSTQRLISFTQTGTAKTWSLFVTTGGALDLRAYDDDGTQILSTGSIAFAINGEQKSIGIELTQSGSDISYTLFVYDIADSTLTSSSGATTSGTLTGHTVGRATEVRFGEDGLMNDTALGHLAVSDSNNGFASTAGALIGWDGETAAARIHRLGVEEQFAAYSTAPGDEQAGVQARATVLELMRAAGEVDEGILCEQRDVLGIRLVQRASMYNQTPALVMSYTGSDGLVSPLDPVDDDQSVTNDVTVSRSGGSSARVTLNEGALSTAAPPDGIGLYDTAHTLGLYDDTQPALHAGWKLHLGTWDETRFPQVTVNLANAPSSIDDAAAVDVGSRVQITNPPVWLPPDTLDLLCQGYSEVLDQFTWTITYNCTPYGPFNVARVGDTTYGKADTAGSELAAAMTSSATTAYVLTTSGPEWTTSPAQFPIPLRVAGEVWSATDVDSWATDAFGRTVSNGWGSADSGQAWSTGGGTAANYNVTSGYGSHTLATANASRRTFLGFDFADFDAAASFTTSATATGGFLSGSLTGRYIDSDNLYMARVAVSTTNTLTLTIRKRVAATETELASLNLLGFTYTPGTTYIRIRFQVIGSALKAKAWPVDSLEPGSWQIEVTDTSLTTSDFIGLRSISASTNTNVNPEIRYDTFEVTNPQKFTVTRSVNGVTKTQAAGADVRLAYPAVTAL